MRFLRRRRERGHTVASRTYRAGAAAEHTARTVAAEREARGWEQRELAERLTQAGRPMTQPIVSRIESGTRRVDVDDLVALAAVFGVSPAVLLPAAEADETDAPRRRRRRNEPGPVELALADDIENLGDLIGMEPTHAAVAHRLARQMDGHHPVPCEECGASVYVPNDAKILPNLARELRATVAALVEGRAVDDDDDDDLGDLGGL
ncbi:helix-turn-helix domain-containing protein [Streptomyces arboris]|uniref:helix-turn-helix domain-containing protein n=1 Tax=Streptomyces arboris TaxID=2600619 RepID=UPI003C2DB7D4